MRPRLLFFRDASFWCLGASMFAGPERTPWLLALAMLLWGIDLYANKDPS